MKRAITVLMTWLALLGAPQIASAVTVVTSPGDDAVLQAILGFDAGPLGIVDMDFAGPSFNDAFGTDAVPSGYLFPTTSAAAVEIMSDISALLNAHGVSTGTTIEYVLEANTGDMVNWINVAFDISPSENGRGQIGYGSPWPLQVSSSYSSRDHEHLTYARMTAAVPVPAAVWLFGSGLIGLIGIARRKKAA